MKKGQIEAIFFPDTEDEKGRMVQIGMRTNGSYVTKIEGGGELINCGDQG